MIRAALGTVLALLVGCGPSLPEPSATPSEPTALSKCQVALSIDRPLVTEWSATEKANLEASVARRAVAVDYRGCEMRVVTGCELDGAYVLERTTLATDTHRVSNEDELYAKLPLGAATLGGQLERAGSLSLRTTVAGQYRLDRTGPFERPEQAACAEATHVVTAVTVGAFELRASERAEGGAEVGVGALGGGVRSERGESLLRSAGDPNACELGESAEDELDLQCRSPIQVFLAPFRDSRGAPVAPELSADSRTAVQVRFEPADSDERWQLKDGKGQVVCDLPCERWVAPGAGYQLYHQADDADDVLTISVPSDLGFAPGSRIVARPSPARGNVNVGGAMVGIGIGVGLGIPAAVGSECKGGSDAACGVGIGGFGLGLGLFVTGVVYLFAYWQRDDVVETERNTRSAASLPPLQLTF